MSRIIDKSEIDKIIKSVMDDAVRNSRKIDDMAIKFAKEYIFEKLGKDYDFDICIDEKKSADTHIIYIIKTNIVDRDAMYLFGRTVAVDYSCLYKTFDVMLIEYTNRKTYHMPEEDDKK